MNKKVLIIGGAGYIGSHVNLAFLDHGWSVTTLDNFSSGFEENIPAGVRLIKGDLLDRAMLKSLLDEAFDAVVHLAGKKAAGESMVEPEIYCNQNLAGGQILLEEMVHSPSKNLIFSSTASVYGEPQYIPMDEKHPTHPINYYGYTKLAFEENLKWFSQLRGLKYVVFRYFNAAGYDKNLRVSGLEGSPANLIPILMEVVFGVREEVEIYGDDYETRDGTCTRDYIHVSDLAEAHYLAAEYLLKEDDSLTLNLGTAEDHSVKEVIAEVERQEKKALPQQIIPRRPGDPAVLVANYDLAEAKLGWKHNQSDLPNIVATTLAAYRKFHG